MYYSCKVSFKIIGLESQGLKSVPNGTFFTVSFICICFTGIRDARAGKSPFVLCSKIGPYKMFFSDGAGTAPNEELESEVVLSLFLVIISVTMKLPIKI